MGTLGGCGPLSRDQCSTWALEEEECKDMLYVAAAVVLSLLEQSEAELLEWWLPALGYEVTRLRNVDEMMLATAQHPQ